jgi:serine/threonine protein phosphatase 1
MAAAPIPVAVSDWQPAGFDVAGESVFAVGDVHGCARELAALLDTIAETESAGPRRLIFLGDMIDRGPDTLGALRLWAQDAEALGVERVDRLMGNHEQLLLLAITGSPHAAKAEAMWRGAAIGGESVLAELRAHAGDGAAAPSRALVRDALGDAAFGLFTAMASHVALGNALFVHGGLDPEIDADELLARPWTSFTAARWAWIQDEFLTWKGGFGGRIVVHGHTPPHKHGPLTGQADPHELQFDRLGLDGGTTRTGIVTAAQIETGRYRILRALGPALG